MTLFIHFYGCLCSSYVNEGAIVTFLFCFSMIRWKKKEKRKNFKDFKKRNRSAFTRALICNERRSWIYFLGSIFTSMFDLSSAYRELCLVKRREKITLVCDCVVCMSCGSTVQYSLFQWACMYFPLSFVA